MSTAQLRAIEDYNRLLNRNAISHAIRAAVHLGVLRELQNGQRTVEQLSQTLELQEQPLQLLMNVLVETELIENYGADYALSAVARLIPAQASDLGDRYWQYLAGTVKSGVRLPNDDEIPVSERDYLIDMATAEWTNTPVALDAANALELGEIRKQLRVLEIGCGAAVFGAALAHRDPASHLILVDDAESLKRAEKTVEGVEIQNRTRLIEADYTAPDLADQLDNDTFDLVLVAGVLHRHQPDEVERLLGQFRNLVKMGGELCLIDVFPGQDEGNTQRAIMELELFLRTRAGHLQSPAELQNLLKKLSFTDVQFAHLPSSPHCWGLVVATREN